MTDSINGLIQIFSVVGESYEPAFDAVHGRFLPVLQLLIFYIKRRSIQSALLFYYMHELRLIAVISSSNI